LIDLQRLLVTPLDLKCDVIIPLLPYFLYFVLIDRLQLQIG